MMMLQKLMNMWLLMKETCGMMKDLPDTRTLDGVIEIMWKGWLPNEMYVIKPSGNLNRLEIYCRCDQGCIHSCAGSPRINC